jgi:hypothetical protein
MDLLNNLNKQLVWKKYWEKKIYSKMKNDRDEISGYAKIREEIRVEYV